MPTLYVIEPGARLEKEYGRLLVTLDDEVILRVPLQSVSQVVLVGEAGVTTPALHALLQAGVSLLLVSRTGKFLGRLHSPLGANLPLRQAQYRRNDEQDFCLGLARAIVAGKIRNQRVLAMRLARRRGLDFTRAIDDLHKLQQAAEQTQAQPELLGIEGQASRVYFAVYRQAFDPRWAFSKRTRRPPLDPANALLSLGYTILGYAAMAALETVGLDPYLGFFHAEKYGRPALALDLVEELRAPLVDSLVLDTLNHRILLANDFEPDPRSGGTYLTTRGLRIFLKKFSQRLEAPLTPRGIGRPISYRKLLEVQARKLAHVILGEESEYKPFQAR